MNRYHIIATVHLCVIRDKKILLSKRKNTGYRDNQYSLIGGHLETDETIINGVIREVFEEIGVKLDIQKTQLVHVMHRRKEHSLDEDRIEFYFTSDFNLSEIINKEYNKCDSLLWADIFNLPDNTVPYIKHFIQEYHKQKNYSEFGW